MSDKIKLKESDIKGYSPPSHCTKSIPYMLPYFKSTQPNNKFYHKIKSAKAHWRNGNLSHVSITFRCGNGGFVHKGYLTGKIPSGGLRCKRCFDNVDNGFISGLLYLQ